MATAVAHRTEEKTGSWSSIFPNEISSSVQSAKFVKKLLAVAVSNIAYLRAVFPENAFGDRRLKDLNLKILRDDKYPGASQVIKWMEGCFDALDNKYLRVLIIGLYKDPNDPETVIEAYTFKFSYADKGGIDIYRNEEKIAGAHSDNDIKKATKCLLRNIILLTQTLDTPPDDVLMTMKLLYYDDVTPKDYEPPGFKTGKDEDFEFLDEPMTLKVGDVNTAFHGLKVRVKTDKKQFEFDNQQSQTSQDTQHTQISTGLDGDINLDIVEKNTVSQPTPSSVRRSQVSQPTPGSVRHSRVSQPTPSSVRRSRVSQPTPSSVRRSRVSQPTPSSVRRSRVSQPTPSSVRHSPVSQPTPSSVRRSQKLKEPITNADIPTKSPAKPAEMAVDTLGSDCSQMTDTGEEFKVRCPCGCNEDDGLMILCEVCKFWQHGVCFLVMDEEEAPVHHVCDVCAQVGTEGKQPTDYFLIDLTPMQVQATCLWRRTLAACLDLDRVLAPTLAQRLGTEVPVAQGLINRLNKEGFLKPPTKPKKLGRIVNKEKLHDEGIPKYMKKVNKPGDKPGESQSELTQVEIVITEESQTLQSSQIHLPNDVDNLIEKTEGLKLNNKGNKLSRKKKNTEKVADSLPEKNLKRRGRKRAYSDREEDREFELSNTQDDFEDRPHWKKKKCSIPTKDIMV